MKNPIKILHVNKKKECTYFLILEDIFIRSTVPRKGLKKLLKAVKPDLILSDPMGNALQQFDFPYRPMVLQKPI